jgi:protein SCO1/2
MLRMLVVFVLAALVAPPVAYAVPSPPNEARVVGRPVPDVELRDDRGQPFRLGSLAGKPLVLNPVFTRCPHVCPMITSSLRDGLLAIGIPGDDYEVVTVSFDPADTVDDLRDYRERLELPDGWRLAIADSAELDTLLSAIDFHYEPLPGGGFAHANVVAVLTPDHHVSGYLHGVTYEESDIRRALLTAVAPPSLVAKFRPLMLAASLLALLAVLVVLWVTKRRRPSQA